MAETPIYGDNIYSKASLLQNPSQSGSVVKINYLAEVCKFAFKI